MEKLFFFDIDGTLIECSLGIYSILDETKESLDKLKEYNHGVFLATGRCKCFIVDGVMEYPFSGYVTCNGACVEYNNEIVYKKNIDVEAIEKTVELCKEHGYNFYFEASDMIYVRDKQNQRHIEFCEEWGMKEEYTCDQFDPKDIEVHIGMIVVNKKEDIDIMYEALSPYFNIQRHHYEFSFDLTIKGESKAKGIKKLSEVLGKTIDDTIAFGDARNDIEMLQEVGLGIAMGNGTIEAKEASKYITDNIDEQGITKALHHFEFI